MSKKTSKKAEKPNIVSMDLVHAHAAGIDISDSEHVVAVPENAYKERVKNLGEKTTQQNGVPYLDVSATFREGEIVLNVVNRNKDEAITTDIISQNGSFTGNFTVAEVNGPDIKSRNDFNKEIVSTVEKPSLKTNGNKITYTFPPHSFTMIKGKVQK